MKNDNSDKHGMFNSGSGFSEASSLFPLLRQLREFLQEWRSPRPRFEMTAAPVPVDEIWSRRENHVPGLLSLLLHVSVISALIALSVISYVKPRLALESSILTDHFGLSLPPSARAGGGGGGGVHALTPASRGVPPRAADKQFVPPTPVITNMSPELTAEMTIISLQPSSLPVFNNLVQIGLPTGVIGPLSGGKGGDAGIGDFGKGGHGDGDRSGPGGPGCCGDTGTGGPPPIIRASTPGVLLPSCPVQVEPNYSDEARRAKIQGSVVLAVTVEKDGSIEPNKVVQSLGYGLDEEAQKVLSKWKCVAAKYNGQAVALPIQIKVNFHLY